MNMPVKKIRFTRLVMLTACLLMVSGLPDARAARLKDLAAIQGVRINQLMGYGLVVGLNGTGDKSRTQFTNQALANMMNRLGLHVNDSEINVKNVAAVMVTADLPPFAKTGSKIDITVSSVGDATSLEGGTLLRTALRGANGKVYAVAQGAIALGGYGASGEAGSVTKNHLLTARMTRGATVEREVPLRLNGRETLTLALFNPDFTTARRIHSAINAFAGDGTVKIADSGTLLINVPESRQHKVPSFIADIETLEVSPDMCAKIVVNEKTGTVVIGENVRISTVAISHGNLSITVEETEQVSQPAPFSEGETVMVPRTAINVKEENSNVILMPEGPTIGHLVRALNAIGVSPRDLISIFQSIKAAGALQAELQII
ncbi:MAG: flagellar basal body P-ring protein FlgI [Thermodesulfobacteriota bacterium]|nr:flagellar basal body P-ring protein FlgI [Thermodesulfobacteriota bacterium]